MPNTTETRGGAPRGLSAIWRFSLPDWIFLPAAGLIAAGMIALAMHVRPSGADPVLTDTQFIMTGAALGDMVPGPGTQVQLLTGGSAPLARLTATASLEAAGSLSGGVAAILPAAWEAAVPGRLIRFEVELQGAPGSGLAEARLGYFTTGGGDSGWRAVPVTEEFRTVGFCWFVPADAPLNENESAGIWPDVEGGSRLLLVRALRLTIMPEGTALEACETTFDGRA